MPVLLPQVLEQPRLEFARGGKVGVAPFAGAGSVALSVPREIALAQAGAWRQYDLGSPCLNDAFLQHYQVRLTHERHSVGQGLQVIDQPDARSPQEMPQALLAHAPRQVGTCGCPVQYRSRHPNTGTVDRGLNAEQEVLDDGLKPRKALALERAHFFNLQCALASRDQGEIRFGASDIPCQNHVMSLHSVRAGAAVYACLSCACRCRMQVSRSLNDSANAWIPAVCKSTYTLSRSMPNSANRSNVLWAPSTFSSRLSRARP